MKNSKRALSLAEILISMGIMIMLIIPVYNLLTVSKKGIDKTLSRLQSKIYAADMMDLLVTLSYDDLPPYGNLSSWSGNSDDLRNLLKNTIHPVVFSNSTSLDDIFNVEKKYYREISFDTYNYLDDAVQINFFYKIIKVKVGYTDRRGNKTEYILTNMVKK